MQLPISEKMHVSLLVLSNLHLRLQGGIPASALNNLAKTKKKRISFKRQIMDTNSTKKKSYTDKETLTSKSCNTIHKRVRVILSFVTSELTLWSHKVTVKPHSLLTDKTCPFLPFGKYWHGACQRELRERHKKDKNIDKQWNSYLNTVKNSNSLPSLF